jgi:hypothetical protein
MERFLREREELLKEREAAQLLKRSVHTLRRDRFEGKGLPYIKVGGQVRYPLSRLSQYLDAHTVEPKVV